MISLNTIRPILLFILFVNTVNIFASAQSVEKTTWKELGFSINTINSWKREGVNTAPMVRKWLNAGININSPHIIKAWKNAGADTPAKVKEWKSADIGYREVAEWTEMGINNLSEVQKWLNAGVVVDKNTIVTGAEKVKEWNRQGINTPNELRQWLNVAGGASGIYRWKRFGIKNLKEAKKLAKLGITTDNIKKLNESGISKIEEVKKWFNSRITPSLIPHLPDFKKMGIKNSNDLKEWTDLGITLGELSRYRNTGTLKEYKEWKAIGVKPADISFLKKDGIKSPAEARAWLNSVKTIAIAKKWISAGILDPNEAAQWGSIGFTTDTDIKDIHSWKKNGIKPSEAKAWRENGFSSGYDVKMWKNTGIDNPTEAKRWSDAGIDSAEIKYFKKANINTSKEAKKWKDAGIAPYDIQKWKEIGLNTANEAKAWNDVTSIGNIAIWKKAGVFNPDEVKKWINIGANTYNIENIKKANLNINEISKWEKVGINDIDNIIHLVNGGFDDPDQYKEYKGIPLENAIKLKQWNIKPNKLIKSMSDRKITVNIYQESLYFDSKNTFNKAYNAIKDNCNEIVTDKWFSEIDMAKNKNKCYIFTGKMIQRLDKKSFFGSVTKSGLVSGVKKRYFYAEGFQGSWLENKYKTGIVKGNGMFSYDSKNGKRVVPEGIVVFLK